MGMAKVFKKVLSPGGKAASQAPPEVRAKLNPSSPTSEASTRTTAQSRRSGAQARAQSSSTTLLGDATTVGQFSSKKLLGQ